MHYETCVFAIAQTYKTANLSQQFQFCNSYTRIFNIREKIKYYKIYNSEDVRLLYMFYCPFYYDRLIFIQFISI